MVEKWVANPWEEVNSAVGDVLHQHMSLQEALGTLTSDALGEQLGIFEQLLCSLLQGDKRSVVVVKLRIVGF